MPSRRRTRPASSRPEVAPRDSAALAAATASETTAFEDARVTRASPPELVLHAQGTASGEPCASATVEAPLARQARRAFLVYETELPRPVAIERSLNGAAPAGGLWLQPADAPNTLVDELDPEALEIPPHREQVAKAF